MIKNADVLQKFLFEKAAVRGELVRLEKSYQEIANQHAYPPALTELLGQVLVIANLLGAIIKFKGRLSIQFQGQEELKLILAQCDNEYNFRGLVQYSGDIDQAGLRTALKNGLLVITIDQQTPMQQRYQGIVNWQGDSLAQSIEGYFRESEQLPTRLWMAVNQTTAVGLLLQMMPSVSDDEENEDWEHLLHLTETIKNEELLNCTNGEIIHRLYHQEDVRLFDPIDVRFQCTCSDKKSQNAILMLGPEEAEKELADKQVIVVTCEFCNKKYTYDREQVQRIFSNK